MMPNVGCVHVKELPDSIWQDCPTFWRVIAKTSLVSTQQTHLTTSSAYVGAIDQEMLRRYIFLALLVHASCYGPPFQPSRRAETAALQR